MLKPRSGQFEVSKDTEIVLYFDEIEGQNIKVNGRYAVKDDRLSKGWKLVYHDDHIWSLRGDLRPGHNTVQAWVEDDRLLLQSFFLDGSCLKVNMDDSASHKIESNSVYLDYQNQVFLPPFFFSNKPTIKTYQNKWLIASHKDSQLFLASGNQNINDNIVIWNSYQPISRIYLGDGHIAVQIEDRVYWSFAGPALSPCHINSKLEDSWNEIFLGGGFEIELSESFVLFWNDRTLVGIRNFTTVDETRMLWDIDDVGEPIEYVDVLGDIVVVNGRIVLDVCYPKKCQID